MNVSRWMASDDGLSQPLYTRLQSGLEAAIQDGTLAQGSKLPAERELALQLRISRTTVTNAYRELESKGLVRGHVGRGTYVCATPEAADMPFAWRGKMSAASLRLGSARQTSLNRDSMNPNFVSFALGCPAIECFPIEEYKRISAAVLARHSREAFGLGATEGHPALRQELAKRFGVSARRIMVLSGSQQGLDLLARSLVDPGDTVIVERPCYLGALQTFQSAGAQVVGWDVNRSDTDELEDLILRYRPKFIYTVPSYQNPTGRTLTLAQRKELIRVAVRYRIPVIEDDPYRDLFFDAPPPPSLHELDEHGVVIHLSTFSKVLAPGMRLGCMVAPESIVDLLALAKHRANCSSEGLGQLVVADFLRTGFFTDHLLRLRAEHKARRNALVYGLQDALPKGALDFTPPKGGMYLWCKLGNGFNANALYEHAITQGVVFATGELFYADGSGDHNLRLCFSGLPVPRITEGVERLRKTFELAMAKQPAAVRAARDVNGSGAQRSQTVPLGATSTSN